MPSATRYSVVVIVLEEPISRSNIWPAGDFDDYAEAESCAKLIVDNVLLHLEAALRSKGQKVATDGLLAAYLREGEAPIIIGEGDLAQSFNFWAYATQRAASHASDDGLMLAPGAASEIATVH